MLMMGVYTTKSDESLMDAQTDIYMKRYQALGFSGYDRAVGRWHGLPFFMFHLGPESRGFHVTSLGHQIKFG